MNQPLIEMRDVSVIREKKVLLDHITLSIYPNECVTVIGPNGAGKTTLLKTLMGIIPLSKGTVIRSSGVTIGYVPQRFTPPTTLPMKVLDFLKLGNHLSLKEIHSLLEEMHIEALQHQLLSHLSGGEMQRVLIARALLKNPTLLMLDEPAQNLDISGQLELYQLIHRLHEQRRTSILMVSHDLHLVMTSTQRVICLFHHICCSGSPEHITRDPHFERLFGEDFTRMMAVYHHHHAHTHTPSGEIEPT